MLQTRRIGTIVVKELREIVRDHRTMMAIVLVPVVLYPLLIIGALQLLDTRVGKMKYEKVRIAASNQPVKGGEDSEASLLHQMLTEALSIAQEAAESGEPDAAEAVASIEKIEVAPVADVEQAVLSGDAAAGVRLVINHASYDLPVFETTVLADETEISSQSASGRLRSALVLLSESMTQRYLRHYDIPREALTPLTIADENIAPPQKVGGRLLGTIIPLVLVLLTMNGAIYPAMELTAGERERGTMETLLVAPVPAAEVLTGKYLVVTILTMLGALLSLLSVGATFTFGNVAPTLAAEAEMEFPLQMLPVILLTLIPFALLFSALMVAVCSFARSMKEAQNYVAPLIIAALIPGGIAAIPGTELDGVRTVIPVMNMVLLTQDLLLGKWDWGNIMLVLTSTTLYAATAVTIATRIFSTEEAAFADSVSLRAMLSRRMMRPAAKPGLSLALLVTAILFPVWFNIQMLIGPDSKGHTVFDTLWKTAVLMPIAFAAVPIFILRYWRIDLRNALSLRMPKLRFWIAGALFGLGAWAPTHEILVVQNKFFPMPESLLQTDVMMQEALGGRSFGLIVLLIAVAPALCEETLFRGFLLSGLSTRMRKWPALITVGVVFALFHVYLYRFVHTAALGVVLGLLCWHSRSIFPAMLAHFLHNASGAATAFWPAYEKTLGLTDRAPLDHLPLPVIVGGTVLVIVSLLLAMRPDSAKAPAESPPSGPSAAPPAPETATDAGA